MSLTLDASYIFLQFQKIQNRFDKFEANTTWIVKSVSQLPIKLKQNIFKYYKLCNTDLIIRYYVSI